MTLEQEDLRILGKYDNVLSINKMDEAFRIFNEILENLDDSGIRELLGGNGSDIDGIYSIIMEETLSSLYGQRGGLQTKLGYFDHLTGSIEETLCIENLAYFILSKMPNFEMNWHHMEWADIAMRYDKFNVIAARDHGKCLAPETPILMFDGTHKLVKDIIVGDKVMGVDSEPRNVLSLHKGRDNMYKVKQSKGDDYVVNSKHILTTINQDRPTRTWNIRDREIKDVMSQTKNYISENVRGFKIASQFSERPLEVDAYFLGLWLGDGSRHNTGVTTADFEIKDYLIEFANKVDLDVSIKGLLILLRRKNGTASNNRLKDSLKNIGVLNNKHIPEDYIINSEENRLKILAGLIDSDGNYHCGAFHVSSIYRHLGLQIKRVADSLGFRASFYEKTEFNKQLGRDYYSCYVSISGSLHKIPTKVKRKQVKEYIKQSNKDWGVIDNIKIGRVSSLKFEDLGVGDYNGFTCDGDQRFLLADGTVTHNSYFWSNAYIVWKMYRYRKSMKEAMRKGYLFSFSQEQASDLLGIVKETIEESDELRDKLYPGKSDGWARQEITAKNGVRVKTKGFGSSVRGAHPGWIIVDDGLKDNVIYSSDQRKKSIDYFHAVIMNMIVPKGQVGVVGTPFHSSDLYGDLKSKKGWHVREYPAIFPDGKILWSNRWNFQDLLDKRETQGNLIFSRENLVKPVTNESTIFPMHIIKRAYVGMDDYKFVESRQAFKKKFDRVVTSVDFSISSSVGADYTVIITTGIDDDDNMWMMNITRFKGKTFAEQMAIMKQVNHAFRPDIMILENNVFQQIFVQESERLNMPVEGHTTGTNKYDLKAGLPGLAILFERDKIKIPRGDQRSIDLSDSLAVELASVTWTEKGLEGVGEHDDQAMSLWLNSIGVKKLTSGFSFKFL